MALYKGFLATCLRDVPGWATLFYVNEKLKDKLGVTAAEQTGESWDSQNLLKRMFVGGFAGQISWLISYPYDVIKTQI